MKTVNKVVYDELHKYIVHPVYKKKRREDKFTLVSSCDFKLFYLNEAASDFLNIAEERIILSDVIAELGKIYHTEKKELIETALYLIRDLQWKKIIILK